MPSSQFLDDLEHQLLTVPPESIKHDLEPGFHAMADWIRALDQGRRQEVLNALPGWLTDVHPWHSRAALEIALLLHNGALLDQAVQVARSQGVRDISAPPQYPEWLEFQLNLIRVLAAWGPSLPKTGTQYLKALSNEAGHASSYSRRLLSIRAWLTICHLEKDVHRLEQAIQLLRNWRDDRLRMSGLTLIHAYYCRNGRPDVPLNAILTQEELAIACPESLD